MGTLPGGATDVNIPDSLPTLLFPMGGPGTFSRGISSGYALTQANVEDELKRTKVIDNPNVRGPKGGVDNWLADLGEAFGTAADAVWKLLLMLPLVGDVIEVVTGKEDGDLNDLGTAINGINYRIQAGWDLLVNGLLGWNGFDWQFDDAEKAVQDVAATIAALSAQVTALANGQNNASVGGRSAMVDFSGRANALSLGADFDQTYSGAGTSVLGVDAGAAAVIVVYDQPRSCFFTYNDLETATDYQKIGVAFATAPEPGFSNPSRNEIHGRKDAAGTTYVYASMERFRCQLGCLVAGATTVFVTKTSGFSFKANSIYWLECGTVGALRIFRLLEGNTVILTHTEVGTTSQAGPGYRRAGGMSYVFANGVGANLPGRIAAFAVSDNQPPTVVGSGAVMYRGNTTPIPFVAGETLLPNNFFDAVAENTADITIDLNDGSFTASIEGWYRADLHLKIANSTNTPNHLSLTLVKTTDVGVEKRRMSLDAGRYIAGGAYGPECVHGSCPVYLQKNDSVKFQVNASSIIGGMDGEPSGEQTWAALVLENRSTN